MLLFDFDGVLVDSVREIALSAHNLVTGFNLYRLEDLPPGFLENFVLNRHLLLGPSRLAPLARWCLKQSESGKTAPEYLPRERFFKEVFTEESPDIADIFFAARQRLIDEHPKEWLLLNQPFQPLWGTVRALDQKSFVILTYKNRAAVLKICSHYGLELSPSQIFSGEGGRTKRENILALDKAFLAEAQSDDRGTVEYIFLDDALENLRALTAVLPGRIRGVHASWGYNTAEDQLTAQKEGFSVASQGDFIKTFLSNDGSERNN